jgi:hypothetical protein
MSDSELPDPAGILDLDRLLAQNPDVDAKQLREVLRTVKARRRAGHSPRSYNIDSPYERRPLAEGDSMRSDN